MIISRKLFIAENIRLFKFAKRENSLKYDLFITNVFQDGITLLTLTLVSGYLLEFDSGQRMNLAFVLISVMVILESIYYSRKKLSQLLKLEQKTKKFKIFNFRINYVVFYFAINMLSLILFGLNLY